MTARTCRCGCGASLALLRADAVWASDTCRKAYRAGRAPASPAKARNHGRSSGAQVAYFKGLAQLTSDLSSFVEPSRIEESLRRALPERQRRGLAR